MNGIIVVDKPEGITSFRVISILRRLSGQKRIGHSGTLDPMATGVLPVFFGTAARAVDILPETDKSYDAEVLLGVETDTQDITGNILNRYEILPSEEEIMNALNSFLGEIEQIPPMYSAVSVDGKRLYELAREGKTVERTPRKAIIYDIKNVSLNNNKLSFNVSCSKGTYVRTLADDLGKKLGIGACLSSLRRTSSGIFNLNDALSIEDLEEAFNSRNVEKVIKPTEIVFSSYPEIKLSERQTVMFNNGVTLDANRIEGAMGKGIVRVKAFTGEFLGLAKESDGEFEIIKNLRGELL